MQQTNLHDLINVICVFNDTAVRPHSFKWSGKTFRVEKINLVFMKRKGDGRLVYFSVTAEGNYFKIVFDTGELKWYLEETVFE
jgi:hypothetical protein